MPRRFSPDFDVSKALTRASVVGVSDKGDSSMVDRPAAHKSKLKRARWRERSLERFQSADERDRHQPVRLLQNLPIYAANASNLRGRDSHRIKQRRESFD
jgi:hypothetical protein